MAKFESLMRRYHVWIGTAIVFLVYVVASSYTKQSCADIVVNQEAVIEDKKVAITFDDGPSPMYTPGLLDGLLERNVKATFFVIGEEAEKYPAIIERMSKEGHEIGNHTYTHVNLCCLCKEDIVSEVCHTNDVIEEITGERPIYIRPPFGSWSKDLGEQTGMIEVLWDVDPKDWNTNDCEAVITRVLKKVDDRNIILLHDSSQSSVDAALAIIDALKQQGYSFVGVDEILFD